MLPTCIEEAVKFLEKGDFDCVDLPIQTFTEENGVITDGGLMTPNPHAIYESAFNQNPFTSFMLYKSEVWNKYNGYDTSITPAHINTGIEDCEFHLRLLRDKVKIGFLDKVLYKYRIHGNQSHRQAAPHLEELYNIIRAKHNRNG